MRRKDVFWLSVGFIFTELLSACSPARPTRTAVAAATPLYGTPTETMPLPTARPTRTAVPDDVYDIWPFTNIRYKRLTTPSDPNACHEIPVGGTAYAAISLGGPDPNTPTDTKHGLILRGLNIIAQFDPSKPPSQWPDATRHVSPGDAGCGW